MAKLKCIHPFPTLCASYKGDRAARFSFWQPNDKPWDWKRAERVASNIRFNVDEHPAMPKDIWIEHGGQIFRPTDPAPVAKARITVKSIAKMVEDFLAGAISESELREVTSQVR